MLSLHSVCINIQHSDFYVVIGTQQFAYSAKGQGRATGANFLLETELFDGKEAAGWVIYQLPYTHVGESDSKIVWDHQCEVVVYYQKSTSSTTNLPTTQQAQEQVILRQTTLSE